MNEPTTKPNGLITNIITNIRSQSRPPTKAFISQCKAEADALPNGDGSLLSVHQFFLLGHIKGELRYLKASEAFSDHDGRLKAAYWHVSRQNLTLQQAWAYGYSNNTNRRIPQWEPHRSEGCQSRILPSYIEASNAKARELKDRPDWVTPLPSPAPPPAASASVNIQGPPRDQTTAIMTPNSTTMNPNTAKGDSGRKTGVLEGFREAQGTYDAESRMEESTTRCRPHQARPQPQLQPASFAVARPAPAVRSVARKRKELEADPGLSDEPLVIRTRRRRKSEVFGRRKRIVNDDDEMDTDLDEDGPEAEVASSNGELPGEAFYNKYAQLPRGSSVQAHLERPMHLTPALRANIGLYLGEPPGRPIQTTASSRAMTPAHGSFRSHSFDPGLEFATPAAFSQYKDSQYRNRTSRTPHYDAEREEAEMIQWERAAIARRQAKADMTGAEYQQNTARQSGVPAPRNFQPRIDRPFMPDPEAARYVFENDYRGVPAHRMPLELSVHTQAPTMHFQKWKEHNKEKLKEGNAPSWIHSDGYDEAFVRTRPLTSPGGSNAVASSTSGIARAASTPSNDQEVPTPSAGMTDEVPDRSNIDIEAPCSPGHAEAAVTSSQGNDSPVATPSTSAADRASKAAKVERLRVAMENPPLFKDERKVYERIPGIKSYLPGGAVPVTKSCPSHVECDSMKYYYEAAITKHPNFKSAMVNMKKEPTPEIPNIIFYKAMWFSPFNTDELKARRNLVAKYPKMSLDRWDGVNYLACNFTIVEKFTIANVTKFLTNAYKFYPNKPHGNFKFHAELAVVPESVRLRWKRWKPVPGEEGDQDEVVTPAHQYRWNHDVEDIQADIAIYGTLIVEFGVRDINESERLRLESGN